MTTALFYFVDDLVLPVFRNIDPDNKRGHRGILPLSRYVGRHIPAALLYVVDDVHFPAWDVDVEAFQLSFLPRGNGRRFRDRCPLIDGQFRFSS